MGSIIWCGIILGEDPGFGDAWRVQLPNKYLLLMIDTPDEGFIETPKGTQSVYGITRIAQDNNTVFGETQDGYFVLDTLTHQLWTFDSKKSQQEKCFSLGINFYALLTTEEFYYSRRSWFLSFLPFIVFGIIFFVMRNRYQKNVKCSL